MLNAMKPAAFLAFALPSFVALGTIVSATSAFAQGGGSSANAAPRCRDAFNVNAFYPSGPGPAPNTFIYIAQIQNRSRTPLRMRVGFSGFPQGTVIYETSEIYGPVGSYQQINVTAGHSTARLSLSNVKVVFDNEPANGAAIRISNCTTGS